VLNTAGKPEKLRLGKDHRNQMWESLCGSSAFVRWWKQDFRLKREVEDEELGELIFCLLL